MTESEFLIQHAGIKLESHPFSFETPRRDHVEQGVRRRQGFENVVKKGVLQAWDLCALDHHVEEGDFHDRPRPRFLPGATQRLLRLLPGASSLSV